MNRLSKLSDTNSQRMLVNGKEISNEIKMQSVGVYIFLNFLISSELLSICNLGIIENNASYIIFDNKYVGEFKRKIMGEIMRPIAFMYFR